ncbi:MAG: FAD-binding oxidoreductase [Pseudomonadota bacterium]
MTSYQKVLQQRRQQMSRLTLTRRALLQGSMSGLLYAPFAGAANSFAQPENVARVHSALAKDLRARVVGPVHVFGEPNYELKRTDVWSRLVPARFPQAIVTASKVEDVVATVQYAAANGFRVSIRGGGHNWSVSSLRDDAILLDLGQLRSMRIDPSSRRAKISPGVSSAALVEAASPYGLGFPVAHCPSVPLSGFLLNGGFGWNTNTWGTAAAHIEEMSIVTADGELLRASERENSELFWAARGSGPGFFGVVVEFVLNLQTLPKEIRAANFIVPLSLAGEMAQWVDDKRDEIPVNVELAYLVANGGGIATDPGLCAVSAVSFRDNAADALDDLSFLEDFPLASRALVHESGVPTSFEDLLETTSSLFPPGLRYLGNTHWTEEPLNDFYPQYAEHLTGAPTPFAFSNCVLYPTRHQNTPSLPDAAVSMQRQVLCLHYAIWESEFGDSQNHAWFRKSDDLFKPHSQGHYIGETDLNLFPENAGGSYSGPAWQQIQELRKRHDPQGLFYDYLQGESLSTPG